MLGAHRPEELDVTAPSSTVLPATTTDPAVRVTGAVKVYGEGATEVRALDGVDLEVPRGQFLAIMGPSGSGKSTLLHCAAGLDRLTSGSVEIDGVRTDELSDRRLTRLRREQVGFVFQSYNLVPTLTAAENITLPLDLAGADVDRAWYDQITATLGLGDRLHHSPAELSGGQQQRVAAARALVTRPAVVFADEPTGALDSRSGAELLGFLQDAARTAGQTAVMVTHDPAAASYADRLLFLADGRVVDEMTAPTADAILDRMKRFEADEHTPGTGDAGALGDR
ncbi:ABC transporter ATP-binding protein [Nitriliruptor alkaliphilus]|uniref:ABC transporter ATP-binding protein n=1 Tax=Nitriliruptor alkaliphilus TaxID=427918 RepID=UPI0009FA92C1